MSGLARSGAVLGFLLGLGLALVPTGPADLVRSANRRDWLPKPASARHIP